MALPGTNQQAVAPTPAQTAAGIKDALVDRSQHIRTMAKDLAALASNKNVEPEPTPEAQPEPSRHETISGVTTELAQQPFFERQLPRHEREIQQEAVPLPTIEEASEIVEVAPIQPPSDQTETQRAELLERLRSRVGETAHMSLSETPAQSSVEETEPAWPDIPTPPAQFPQPTPQPLPSPEILSPAPIQGVPAGPAPFLPTSRASAPEAPSPVQPSYPERAPVESSLPPVLPGQGTDRYREPFEDVPAPVLPRTPASPSAVSQYSGLQTYSGDFSDHLSSSGSSAFSVLAAEQDAQPGTAPRSERRAVTPRALIAIATGVVLLGLAGGGMYAVYQMVMTMRSAPIAPLTVPSIIFADSYRNISGTGPALIDALAASINEPLLSGQVLVTYLIASATGEDGSIFQRPIGGGRLFTTTQLPAPDILLRNVRDEGSAGVVNTGIESRPFFVLRVDSYERTFAGMLTWEPLMFQDLSKLFPLHPPRRVIDGRSSG